MKQNDNDEMDSLLDEYYEDDFWGDDSCSGGYEWTEEDAWDALTDGMYGDYPGSDGWDNIFDAMGL